jgi:hypothetical protein
MAVNSRVGYASKRASPEDEISIDSFVGIDWSKLASIRPGEGCVEGVANTDLDVAGMR